MYRKNVFLLLVSLVMLMSLFSNAVSAQSDEEGALGGVFETIYDLFKFIPEVLTLDKLIEGTPSAIFWAKFLIWLLLFSIIYFGASMIPSLGENKRITVVIAIAISLMSALLIPDGIIINIFQSYGLVSAMLIWFIPVAATMWLAWKVPNRWVRSLILILAVIVLAQIDSAITRGDESGIFVGGDMRGLEFFRLLYAVIIIALIWNIFALGFEKGGGTTEGLGRLTGDKIENLGDKIFGRGGDKEDTTPEDRRAKQLANKEQGELSKLINTNFQSLKKNIQIKEFLENLKHQMGNEQLFISRKGDITLRLRKLYQYIKQGENVDKEVYNELKGKNKKILEEISKFVKNRDKIKEENLEKELSKALGAHEFAKSQKIKTELSTKEDKDKIAEKVTRIEKFFNDVIEKEAKDRVKLFEKLKEDLEKIIQALGKEFPDLEEIKKLFGDAIKKIDDIIKRDSDISKREKKMFDETKFTKALNTAGQKTAI